MKCLAAFSTLPDLLYLWTDVEFKNHLIEVAEKNGITEVFGVSHDADEDESMQAYANHFFSPIVTSNKYMEEMNNSYRSIVCANGFIFSMNQISDLFFIAVCGDGEESELFLQRKINFFSYLLRFHYGPCAADLLKPPYALLRKQAWSNMNELLITWQTLCQQEQMFLVEALERLHVNQQLNSISLNLLGEALLKTNKDGQSVHSLLLVNNKLLGLYSNERSPELQISDILLLIVLVKHKFQYSDDTVPRSVYRTPTLLNDNDVKLKDDKSLFSPNSSYSANGGNIQLENEFDSTLDYHSAPSSLGKADVFYSPEDSAVGVGLNKSDTEADLSECISAYDLSMNEADLELLSSSPENEYYENASSTHSLDSADYDTMHDVVYDNTVKENPESEENDLSNAEVYFQKSVYLRTLQCECVPHTAHCLLLDSATVLIVISKNKGIGLAICLQSLLNKANLILNMASQKVASHRSKLFDDLLRYANKIPVIFNKTPDLETRESLQRLRLFEKRWKLVLELGLEDFVKGSSLDIPKKLENCINELLKCTKLLFNSLFINQTEKQPKNEKKVKVIMNVRDTAIRKLNHFSLYLHVRGQRNVTMTAYHNDFPGLVHFIYINRNIDQLIAPTINVNTDSNPLHELPMYIIIKQRIWDMWQYAETMLSQGHTALIVRDGDFTFSYFLWFEDTLGKPLATQKTVKELSELRPSGILSSSYYKDLITKLFPHETEGSVHCYELLCMHIGVVNNHFVTTSCQKLTRLLWEASGEANSPINLL